MAEQHDKGYPDESEFASVPVQRQAKVPTLGVLPSPLH
jgi:hypothetical protein